MAGLPAMKSHEFDSTGEVCQILVDVNDTSVLGVSAYNRSGGEGRYQPCDVADQLINIVVPRFLEG